MGQASPNYATNSVAWYIHDAILGKSDGVEGDGQAIPHQAAPMGHLVDGGTGFSWCCKAMCKFNLWIYDSISLQQMSR